MIGPSSQSVYTTAGHLVANHKVGTFEIARRDKKCKGGYRVIGCFIGSVSRSGPPEEKKLNNITKMFTPYIMTGRLNMNNGESYKSGDVFRGAKSGRCLYITGCETVSSEDYLIRIMGSGYYREL